MIDVMKPERCPCLEGELWKKQFEGTDIKNIRETKKEVKFDFKCAINHIMFNYRADFVEERGCLNGSYTEKCRTYAQMTFEKKLFIPLICPVAEKRGEPEENFCTVTNESCDLAVELFVDPFCEEDYRMCETFSKWFWEKVIKEGKVNGK